jgi:hypothetical protein
LPSAAEHSAMKLASVKRLRRAAVLQLDQVQMEVMLARLDRRTDAAALALK